MTILHSGNSLFGSANAPESGFRPGARWGPWRMLGALVRVGARLSLTIGAVSLALGAWGGAAVCALSPGFLFAGLLAVANAMFYLALTWLEYTGCEHMCVALGEWRTDAASEEVYVGAGGGIASVA